MDIHKRQYILSSDALDINQMTEIKTTTGFLYIGTGVNVTTTTSRDGVEVFLIGNAFCMDEVGKMPVQDIKSSSSYNLIEATRNWTGRWVLFYKDTLFTDASGLMSAFFHTDNNNRWIVSSSLAVISEILGSPQNYHVPSTGLTWQLLPLTILPDVNCLFCTQDLKFNSRGPTTCSIHRFKDMSHLATSEKVRMIGDMLCTGIKNIAKFSGRKITVALTSGKDSRLTFASAIKSGIEFETYTAWHRNISNGDRSLPCKISNDFGIKHHYIKKNRASDNTKAEYLEFCGGNSNGADLEFYVNGQFDQIANDRIVIRSGIFEAAQTYGRTICGDTPKTFEDGFRIYYKTSLSRASQSEALTSWLQYCQQNPIDFIDLRDRFYIEQRVNGWVAAIEQSLDINDIESIQIANCADLISVLLSATSEERENLSLAYKTIEYLDNRLMKYPINKRSLYDKINLIRNRISRMVSFK